MLANVAEVFVVFIACLVVYASVFCVLFVIYHRWITHKCNQAEREN